MLESSPRKSADTTRGVESLLWLAAGAAWALVALRVWNQSRQGDARRKTFWISERLLRQAFPNGIRR
jgi:hypothetical protein